MGDTHAVETFFREPGEETFRAAYESTRRLVWTLCLRILRDPADAADAFQSAYCRLLGMARDPGLREPGVDPGEAVYRIAVREADRLRKERARRGARRVQRSELEHMTKSDESPAEQVEKEEARRRVEAVVEALPERHRLPIQLHYLHGLSQREVARALGLPLATVAGRVSAA